MFENCLLTTELDLTGAEYVSVLRHIIKPNDPDINSPSFLNAAEDDYHIQSNSVCRDYGKLTFIFGDLDDVTRDIAPDLGAYEYTP